MKILDGKIAREHYTAILNDRIKSLNFVPCLVIIQVGNMADSDSYIKAKKSFAEKIGVNEIHVKLNENITESELIESVEKYNNDNGVQGIIVQLPLPKHINPDFVIGKIDPKKDVDGLTEKTLFIPATARGIKELLEFYKIDLKNKKVTVLGQSRLVGKPISEMCKKVGAIVTSCDSQTKDIIQKSKNAEILVVAIGKPKLIDDKYITKDQIVVDVGITRLESGFSGDVDFEKVKDIVSAITPVPGGVGVMTVLSLFENLVDACYNTKY